jgi:hypothetical protein
MQPQRRTDGLLVEELPDETVVYDQARLEAHCLNRVATFVWKHCDGRTSTPEMVKLLRAEMDVPADETMVGLVVEQLEELHLLVEQVRRTEGVARPSRRHVARRLAVLGLAGLIVTIPVPTALAASSRGQACTASSQCATGCCCQDNSHGFGGKCGNQGTDCNNCM